MPKAQYQRQFEAQGRVKVYDTCSTVAIFNLVVFRDLDKRKDCFFLGWKTGRSGAWSKFYPEHVKLLEIGKKNKIKIWRLLNKKRFSAIFIFQPRFDTLKFERQISMDQHHVTTWFIMISSLIRASWLRYYYMYMTYVWSPPIKTILELFRLKYPKLFAWLPNK